MANKYILIIEDKEFILRLYRECLLPEKGDPVFPDHIITICTDLNSAYTFYERHWEDIDAIVTDSGLPDGIGEDFIIAIKEMPGKQYRKKVIFIAGQLPKAGCEILFFKIFLKPIGISDFLGSIKEALEV